MAQIFLSYSRNDGNEYVERLEADLKEAGFETWRDKSNLDPYQDFSVEIELGIRNADYVIVCITPSVELNPLSFVRREIIYAQSKNIPIIPLMFPDATVPVLINHLTWIAFFDRHDQKKLDYEYGFSVLLMRLRAQKEPGSRHKNSEDPFRTHLEEWYDQIVEELRIRIIRQIDLRVEPTPDVVTTPHTKSGNIRQFFSGVTMGNDPKQNPHTFNTFAEGFKRYKGRVLLLGEPGAGKTITLMAYARDAIWARLQDINQPLPLLGLIPTWDSTKQTSLAAWLAETYGLEKAAVQREVEQGRALLLLDGLDELGRERPVDPEKPDGEKYDPRLRFIKALPANTQILMTSRIEDYRDMMARGEKAVLSGAITLQPLGEAQMAEYLADQPELWQLIQEDEQLREITTTPLLMSLFAFAYQDMSADERVQLTQLQNALDLRDRIFLGYMTQRYLHELNGINLLFSYQEMHNILGELALRNAADSRGETNLLTWYQISPVLNRINIPNFIDLMTRLHILVPTTNRSFHFVHTLLYDALVYEQGVAALRHTDSNVRKNAAFALGRIRDVRAVESLTAALTDKDESCLIEIIDALGEIRDVRGTLPLITIVNNKNLPKYIRAPAIAALGQIGDVAAVEPLIAVLREAEDWWVPKHAIDALGYIADGAVEPLINALGDTDETFRRRAAFALGRVGNAAVEPLIIALSDKDVFIRESAALALGESRDTRATESLIAALNDERGHVCSNSIDALGKIRDARAVEPLIAILNNKRRKYRPYSRQLAAQALGKIGDTRAVEPLIAILNNSSERSNSSFDREPHSPSAYALGEIGDVRAIDPLIAALNHKEWDVRATAARALGKIGDVRAVEPLIANLKDNNPEVRKDTAKALEQIAVPKALKAVELYRTTRWWQFWKRK